MVRTCGFCGAEFHWKPAPTASRPKLYCSDKCRYKNAFKRWTERNPGLNAKRCSEKYYRLKSQPAPSRHTQEGRLLSIAECAQILGLSNEQVWFAERTAIRKLWRNWGELAARLEA